MCWPVFVGRARFILMMYTDIHSVLFQFAFNQQRFMVIHGLWHWSQSNPSSGPPTLYGRQGCKFLTAVEEQNHPGNPQIISAAVQGSGNAPPPSSQLQLPVAPFPPAATPLFPTEQPRRLFTHSFSLIVCKTGSYANFIAGLYRRFVFISSVVEAGWWMDLAEFCLAPGPGAEVGGGGGDRDTDLEGRN